MKNKINIAELLKDCPKGMELNCTCADNVVFDKIIEYEQIKCVIGECREPLILDKYGRLLHICCPKCVIFPKGKTTWEGFQKPFKDGDILYIRASFDWVCIYKEGKDTKNIHKYVATCISSVHIDITLTYDGASLCRKEDILKMRLATEEEKKKLFDAIKANGYKWNPETKTLEKLINKNKFVVGTTITNGKIISKIVSRDIDSYQLEDGNYVFFNEVHNWELVPDKFDISTLNPFDKVLVRDKDIQEWCISFFDHYNGLETYKYSCINGSGYAQCIPYEGNEHLRGTTNNCDDFYKTWEK